MILRLKMLCVLATVMTLAIAGCAPPSNKKSEEPADTKAASGDDKDMPVEAAKPAVDKADETKPEEPAKSDDAAKPAEQAASGKVVLGSPELTAGIPGSGPLKMADINAWLADAHNHETLDFELPFGLAAGAGLIQGVDKNPLTRAKIELGRQLYFDPRLSADITISCSTCHDPEHGFGKHTQFGVGIRGQMGGRNSPVSYNRILSGAQFWDGRAPSLEAQAVGPIQNPIEMGHTHEACVTCLKAVPGYAAQFDKIFGRFDIEAVGEALASFERTLVTGPTPYDYAERLRPFESMDQDDIKNDAELSAAYEKALKDAKEHSLSESAKRGRVLFFSEKANCTACHAGANFTDEKYHNIGIGMDKEMPDVGREDFTKDPKDRGQFKTPTVRNVAASGPYMHDGSQATLEEVVEWYAKGGHPNPNLSEKIKKLDLSDQDKKDLVEFMKQGLTGDFPKINRERLPE